MQPGYSVVLSYVMGLYASSVLNTLGYLSGLYIDRSMPMCSIELRYGSVCIQCLEYFRISLGIV